MTSTYDHRVIQGAQSGEFLRARPPAAARRGRLLRRDLPRRCGSPTSRSAGPRTSSASHDDDVVKQARILELIHAYRVRGHLMADTDPLEYQPAQPPRPRGRVARADAVGPRPRVRHRLVRRRGPPLHEAAQHPRHPARLLLPHDRHRVHAHHGSRAAPLDPGARRAAAHQAAPRGAAADPAQAQPGRGVRDVPADQVRRPEAVLASRAARPRSRCSTRSARPPPRPASTRSRSAWPTAAGSTCSPTSSARSTARSSASSRATSTRARSRAPAT